MAGSLVQLAGSNAPAPTTSTQPPSIHPAPTPAGMANYKRIMVQLTKKKAAAAKRLRKGIPAPVSAPSDPSGTGGPNDPAWKQLADLYKNGLPG